MNIKQFNELNEAQIKALRNMLNTSGYTVHHRLGGEKLLGVINTALEELSQDSGLSEMVRGYINITEQKLDTDADDGSDIDTAPDTAPDTNASGKPYSEDLLKKAQAAMAKRVSSGNTRVGDTKNSMRKLVRVRISCNDPKRSDIQGEVFEASNMVDGAHKKFIPFHSDEAFHVPQLLLNLLKEKKYTHTFSEDRGGNSIVKHVSKPLFSIEVLDPLTKEELDNIATEQRLRADKD